MGIKGYLRKGYTLTPERKESALRHAGSSVTAGTYRPHDPTTWVRDELSRIPKGKPGLSIHRNMTGAGGGWSAAKWEHTPGQHAIVYRDRAGAPVTAASVLTHDMEHGHDAQGCTNTLVRYARPHVTQMVSDRSRGALHAIGTGHDSRVLTRMNASAQTLSADSQKLVAHGLDKQSKLMNYMKRRSQRVQKGKLYHASLDTELPKHLYEGIHAGSVRAALDRAKTHCSTMGVPWEQTSHDHIFYHVKPRLHKPQGSFKEPVNDHGSGWPTHRSVVYKNAYEGIGSRSVYAAHQDEAKVKGGVHVPDNIVSAHQTGYGSSRCGPRCVHERMVENILRKQATSR